MRCTTYMYMYMYVYAHFDISSYEYPLVSYGTSMYELLLVIQRVMVTSACRSRSRASLSWVSASRIPRQASRCMRSSCKPRLACAESFFLVSAAPVLIVADAVGSVVEGMVVLSFKSLLTPGVPTPAVWGMNVGGRGGDGRGSDAGLTDVCEG